MELLAAVPAQRKAVIFMGSALGCPNTAACDAERLVGYEPGVLGGAFQELEPDFHRIVSAATRGNVTIYPINPAGLTTAMPGPGSFESSFGDEEWGLRKLAEFTGGFSLARSNRSDAAFERIVRENSTYYVLGFDSGYDPRDGRYIPVQVRVTRPGLQVRSIGGYLAPRDRRRDARAPETVHAAVWDAVARPLATTGLPMRLFATPFRGDDEDAVIPVTLEIDATKLNLIERGGTYRGQLDVVVAVTDARNRRRPPVRHRASLALRPETFERLQREPLRVVVQLKLPEGRYQIRASAGDPTLAGSVVSDLSVPDFRDDFSLSGVSLSSALTGDTFTVSPHDRIDIDLPAVPTTAREFPRDDVVTVYTEAYENRRRAHTAHVAFELTDASGLRASLRVTEHASEARPRSTTVHAFSSTLDLNAVPPGRYTLSIEATSSLDAETTITREIPIAVR
jgi:hypothetical protein